MDFSEKYEPLFMKIEDLLSKKERVSIAIDGGAASGKTTLAALLAERFDAGVVHMDDFFLRPEQRTPERFSRAGGNFDKERFIEEVIPHVGKKEAFSYRIFDCSDMRLSGSAVIPDCRTVIVEGSYSHHPDLAGAFDLRVFLRVDEDEQKRRILLRNGKKSEMFFNRWIPLENRYFKTFGIEEKADIVICG